MIVVLFRFDHHFGNLEDGHIRFFSDKALEKLFGQFGFEVIEKKYVGRFWPVSNCVYVVGRKVRDA